jgi:hypothetical protein
VSLDYPDIRRVITQGGGIVTTAVMPDSGSRLICGRIQFLFLFGSRSQRSIDPRIYMSVDLSHSAADLSQSG